MTIVEVICSVAILFTFSSSRAYSQIEVNSMNGKLESPDPVVRRSAAKELAVKEPEAVGNAILPLLEQGLQDEDGQVRSYSAAALYRIAWASGWTEELRRKHNVKTELVARPSLKPLLIKAISDPEEEVRENAIKALWLGFPPSPDVEASLTNRFSSEKSPQVRIAIVGALSEKRYPSAREIVLKALEDPNSDVRGWAAHALVQLRPLPPEALQKLVTRVETEQELFTKGKFVDAIGAYEEKALPYVAKLEAMLLTETNLQIAFTNAIQRIKRATRP